MSIFHTRLGVAGFVMLAAAQANAAAGTTPPADLLIDGGKIYTVDQKRSVVEALAVRDGKIVFTGSSNDANPWIGPQTKVVHLGGRLVLPGLFDSHIHPLDIVPVKVCDLEQPR